MNTVAPLIFLNAKAAFCCCRRIPHSADALISASAFYFIPQYHTTSYSPQLSFIPHPDSSYRAVRRPSFNRSAINRIRLEDTMVYTEARSVADAARRRRSSGSFRSYERRRPKQAQLYCYLKRPLDIVLASIALVLLGPVLIVVAGLVVACDGHGALFRQVRVGRGGRRFVCLKFRTMVPDADTLLRKVLDEDADAHRQWIANRKLKHDPRVTKVGRHLRRLSLDELPQLVNVVRGEMSIVGPRPAMESEMILYGSAVDACLRVRPGLTGPWQVGGRANLTFSERVNLESKYAADMSLLCDVRIMLKTIVVLINRDGAC